MEPVLPGVYHPGRARSFAEDECFLCGSELTHTNRSDEHVIPKWVQGEFDLWNERMTLLNGTFIPYRQLVVPCCVTCNNNHLGDIEGTVRNAWSEGFEAMRRLDRDVLFLWLGKIVYGLLVRGLFLPADRSRPDDGSIVEPDLLEELRLHHLLLQAARGTVAWTNFPASIVLVPTKTSGNRRLNFDMADSPVGPVITLRLGHTGVLAVLQDWGTFERSQFDAVERVREHPLAPLQFRELMAFTRYMAQKYRLNPALIVAESEDGRQTVTSGGSLAGRAYDDFVAGEYAQLLAFMFDVAVSDVLVGDQFVSFLTDARGSPIDMPFEARPGPPADNLGTLDY